MVFDDKTLKIIASTKPENLEELMSVKGLGPKKTDSYGNEILDIIKSHE